MRKARKCCSTCGRRRLFKFFWQNSSKKDGLQTVCKDCKRIYFARYYQENHERHMVSVRRRREAAREQARDVVLDHLRSHPCVDCGEDDVLVLEFDHVRGQKLKHVSTMAAKGYALKSLHSEIAKCEVRCANCHRRRTQKNVRSWLWKRLQQETTKGP